MAFRVTTGPGPALAFRSRRTRRAEHRAQESEASAATIVPSTVRKERVLVAQERVPQREPASHVSNPLSRAPLDLRALRRMRSCVTITMVFPSVVLRVGGADNGPRRSCESRVSVGSSATMIFPGSGDDGAGDGDALLLATESWRGPCGPSDRKGPRAGAPLSTRRIRSLRPRL